MGKGSMFLSCAVLELRAGYRTIAVAEKAASLWKAALGPCRRAWRPGEGLAA
jgi:hypothetical protein